MTANQRFRAKCGAAPRGLGHARPRRICSLALLAATLALWPVAAEARKDRLVVVVENRSREQVAGEVVAATLEALLGSYGYEVFAGDDVGDYLKENGIQHGDVLPPGFAAKLLREYRADAVVQIAIKFVLPVQARARGPKAAASIGYTARLLGADDKVRWRASMGFFSDDAEGRGGRPPSKEEFVANACAKLFGNFPKAGQKRLVPEVQKAPPGRVKFPLKLKGEGPAPQPQQ